MSCFELDPRGDVTIVVGNPSSASPEDTQSSGSEVGTVSPARDDYVESKYSILVCRRNVCQASPVWNTMLDDTPTSSWKEAKSEVIPFPDEDPEAILLLLRIAHLQFKLVPKHIDHNLLYHLAITCDKYDCVELVRPWLPGWLSTHKLDDFNLRGNTFICWAFGMEKEFGSIMYDLVRDTSLKDSARRSISLCRGNGLRFTDELMPPGVTESMLAVRQRGLIEIDRNLRRIFDRYTVAIAPICPRTFNHGRDMLMCDCAVLGSLHRGLGSWLHNEVPSEKSHISHSLNEIIAAISNLKIRVPTNHDETCDISSQIRKECHTIVASLEDGVTDEQRSRLKIQAMKCGLEA